MTVSWRWLTCKCPALTPCDETVKESSPTLWLQCKIRARSAPLGIPWHTSHTITSQVSGNRRLQATGNDNNGYAFSGTFDNNVTDTRIISNDIHPSSSCFNMKIPFYQYRKSCCEDKMDNSAQNQCKDAFLPINKISLWRYDDLRIVLSLLIPPPPVLKAFTLIEFGYVKIKSQYIP